jgi:hypothetical protein
VSARAHRGRDAHVTSPIGRMDDERQLLRRRADEARLALAARLQRRQFLRKSDPRGANHPGLDLSRDATSASLTDQWTGIGTRPYVKKKFTPRGRRTFNDLARPANFEAVVTKSISAPGRFRSTVTKGAPTPRRVLQPRSVLPNCLDYL